MNLYSFIKYLALICAPFAPAVFFGSLIYAEALERTNNHNLSLITAVASALALETVGLLAGHTVIRFFGEEKKGFGIAAGGILVAYCAIGIIELWGTAGAIMFFVAFLVYCLIALSDYAERLDHGREKDEKAEATAKKEADEAQRRKEEAEARAAQEAAERQLAQQKLQFEHEERLAQIEAQKAVFVAKQQAESLGKMQESSPKLSPTPLETFSDWRKVPEHIKRQLAHLSPEEVSQMYPHITPKTARNWARLARETFPQLSRNGVHP
jgi:hypothetical protein